MTRRPRLNIDDPTFDEPRDHPGFTCQRARFGYQMATERLGLSLWKLPPGESAYPYHFHLTEEEMLIVLEGRPALRDPDGWSELAPGDVVSFPVGETGAHQVVNRTPEDVRFLAVSTTGEPDIVVYPDSGKLAAAERAAGGGGLVKLFRLADEVGYWDGESSPEPRS